jgi:hypothetical protein
MPLGFCNWVLEFAWDLGFGIWNFASRDLVLGIFSVAG